MDRAPARRHSSSLRLPCLQSAALNGQVNEKRRNGFWNRGKCFRNERDSFCGRVAQLGERLLCKHAFISPKPLNRRLLNVQTPLLVGLLIGLTKLKGALSNFGPTLRKNEFDSSRYRLRHGGPDARNSGPFHFVPGSPQAKKETSELARQDSNWPPSG
jgi:hypothetical protein